ncbi:MAG: hypothetical protein ACOYMF_17590 [Bacteroidales bacterium]
MSEIGTVLFIDLTDDFIVNPSPALPFVLLNVILDSPTTITYTFSDDILQGFFYYGFSLELYVSDKGQLSWTPYEDGMFTPGAANQLIFTMPDAFRPDDSFRISYNPELGNIYRNSDAVPLEAVSNMNVINGL